MAARRRAQRPNQLFKRTDPPDCTPSTAAEPTVGPALADDISPTGRAVRRGMIFTSHHDAPLAFPVPTGSTTGRGRTGRILTRGAYGKGIPARVLASAPHSGAFAAAIVTAMLTEGLAQRTK